MSLNISDFSLFVMSKQQLLSLEKGQTLSQQAPFKIDYDQNKRVIEVIGWITRDVKLCALAFLFEVRLLSKLYMNMNIGNIVNIGDMNSDVEKINFIV